MVLNEAHNQGKKRLTFSVSTLTVLKEALIVTIHCLDHSKMVFSIEKALSLACPTFIHNKKV